VRTYQDYCGGTDFGVQGCNQRIYFGRFRDGTLESPFSGNIVDACPTGVFTDKTFRYRARHWDLEEAPSVCPHCSLGCAVIPGARYRELQRVRGGVNRQTSGFFICDRGRFGYGHANHPQRPRRPRLDGQETGWENALAAARRRLADLADEHGPQAVAFLGSPRTSLESNFQLLSLARSLGSDNVVFNSHPGRDRAARLTASGLGDQARSLEEIRQSDFLLFLGADPLNEGPGLALAARQAVRRGAPAAVIDPRPVELPFPAVHLPLSPERLGEALQAIATGDFESFSRQEATILAGIAARLGEAKRPVLAGGADLLGAEGYRILLEAARKLSSPDRPCGASLLLNGPNSFGAALLTSGNGPDADALLTGIREGRIKALVCLESDPFTDHPHPGRMHEALSHLDFLLLLDYLPTVSAERADIFLPTTVPAESAGTFVNQEGRMLPFASVFDPGTPIRITGDGDHPPRTFEPVTPGSDPRPAWAVLCELQGRSASLASIRRELEKADPRFTGLTELDPEGTGRRVTGDGRMPAELSSPDSSAPGEGLRLLAMEHLSGSEAIASFSPVLDPVRPEPHVWMHLDDAFRLGLAAGETVRMTSDLGKTTAVLRLSAAMAPGLVLVPRLRGTPLEIFVPGSGLRNCLVEKEGA
jgi:NADH-quinone oxidoreductase subunit G